MIRTASLLALIALLSACGDGQPLFDTDTTVAADDNGTDGTITTNENDEAGDGGEFAIRELPPGTDNPAATDDIFRFEEQDPEDETDTGGLVSDVSYNAADDTLNVDNLAFDGLNVYSRGNPVSSLASYALYEADRVTPDFLTGADIAQINNIGLLGNSVNTDEEGNIRSSFAIFRSGGYFDYGFGGYVYQRRGGVTLPEEGFSGQAIFTGDYAALRVYTGIGGINYVQGDMRIAIDFEDFNSNDGVNGRVINRQMFDEEGDFVETLVDVNWNITEGTSSITEQGEVLAQVFTTDFNPQSGLFELNLEGRFTGIIAGDTLDIADGGEIVGVLRMEGEDFSREDVLVQETGGAILYRARP